jgi:hypothetical protein
MAALEVPAAWKVIVAGHGMGQKGKKAAAVSQGNWPALPEYDWA